MPVRIELHAAADLGDQRHHVHARRGSIGNIAGHRCGGRRLEHRAAPPEHRGPVAARELLAERGHRVWLAGRHLATMRTDTQLVVLDPHIDVELRESGQREPARAVRCRRARVERELVAVIEERLHRRRIGERDVQLQIRRPRGAGRDDRALQRLAELLGRHATGDRHRRQVLQERRDVHRGEPRRTERIELRRRQPGERRERTARRARPSSAQLDLPGLQLRSDRDVAVAAEDVERRCEQLDVAARARELRAAAKRLLAEPREHRVVRRADVEVLHRLAGRAVDLDLPSRACRS